MFLGLIGSSHHLSYQVCRGCSEYQWPSKPLHLSQADVSSKRNSRCYKSQVWNSPIKGFKCSASSSAYAELHCPCPCHPCCCPNNGCEVLNDSCGQKAIASMQSQSMSQSPTTTQICHLNFLDFSPCPQEPLDLMTFFFPITNITKLRSGELSSASRPHRKSPSKQK